MQKRSRIDCISRLFGFLMVVLVLPGQSLAQQTDYKSMVLRYICQYREIAVKEMITAHIPASITMAQGILESNAGQSTLAREANNHFGIKCHKEWNGSTIYKDDDKPNECFRKYNSAQESFRDHSSFLVSRDRYRPLFELKVTDYKGWALGLKKTGYATNPAYADKLIKTIETFRLYNLDRGDYGVSYVDSLNHSGDEPAGNSSSNSWVSRFTLIEITADRHLVFTNNDLRLVVARKGDDLAYLSKKFNIPERKLLRYNDLTSSHLVPGQIIYLQPKRRKAVNTTHLMAKGETLYQVSQGYGIKLRMLYKRNHLQRGMEPASGELIRLR
ncbi:MAG: glucosaminidase domain-containing protein [Bacteroidota bacterium]